MCAADTGIDLTAADFQVVRRLADMIATMNPLAVEQMPAQHPVRDRAWTSPIWYEPTGLAGRGLGRP